MTKKPTAKPTTPAKTAPAASSPAVALKGADAAKTPAEPKKPFNPFIFLREVRTEARKITWPSRKETWITTVMVLLMVVIATVFFALVDTGFGSLTGFLLKMQF